MSGRIAGEQGRPKDAVASFERAVALFDKAMPATRDRLAETHVHLASMLWNLDRFEEGVLHGRRAIQLWEQAAGAWHPRLVEPLNLLALVAKDRGDRNAAIAQWERAIAIRDRVDEPGDMWRGALRYNLAMVLSDAGRHDEAIAGARECVAIYDGVFGQKSAWYGWALAGLGDMLVRGARLDEGEAALLRAQAILATATPEATRQGGLGDLVHGLVELHLHAGRPRRARALVPDLLAKAGSAGGDAAHVAFLAARVLWEGDGSRQEARRLAQSARHGYAAFGDAFATERAQVDEWLATHPSAR